MAPIGPGNDLRLGKMQVKMQKSEFKLELSG